MFAAQRERERDRDRQRERVQPPTLNTPLQQTHKDYIHQT